MKNLLMLFSVLVLLPLIVWAGPVAEVTGTLSGGGLSGSITASCGDGFVTSGEQCDGSNLNGQTCPSLGYSSGSLTCTGSCTFDTSGCVSGGGGSLRGGGSYNPQGAELVSALKCPTCPFATSWSACLSGKRNMYVYYCNATTNYTCKSYTEISDCSNMTEPYVPAPNATTPVSASVAANAIRETNQSIGIASAQGRNTTYAEGLLDQAQISYNNGDYLSAVSLATQAKNAAETAEFKVGISQMGLIWIVLLIIATGAIFSSIIFIPRFMYKELEHAGLITTRHVGRKVVLKGYLDPVKKYSTDTIAYRIAHEARPYTIYERLIAVGKDLSIVPDVRYHIYGKILKTAGEDIYFRIDKIKPFI